VGPCAAEGVVTGAVGDRLGLESERVGRGDAGRGRRLTPARENGDDHVAAGEAGVQGFGAGLLDGADAVVDALDFWSLDLELLLHREAARRGQWVFTSQGAAEITTVTSFDPSRPALDGMVCDAGELSRAKAITSFLPVLPRAATPELLARAIAGELPSVPLDVLASSFEATFLVNELMRVTVRDLPAHAVAPDLLVFDQDEAELRYWDAGRGAFRS
jgi:hypothetical protein